ncbi:hypothetical protein Btru_038320 [Bulinus truncatus]|nr:hypothetical protein Btru_038320 [Bulinus truncatus]
MLNTVSSGGFCIPLNFGVNVTLLGENVLPNFFGLEKRFDKHPDLVRKEIKGGMPLQAYYKSCIVTDCIFNSDDELTEVGPFIAGSLTIHKEYLFVQKSSWNGSDSYLAVSYQRKEFKRAYFPKDVKTNDFILLNLDDGQVSVAVNHGDHVNLYLSDITGQYYTLSLENVYHTIQLQWFEIDFYEVEGMNWTFIVNKKISTKSGFTSKTYISYDKGGNWAPLLVNQTCRQEPLVGIFRFNIMDQGSILTAIPDGLMSGINSTVVYYSLDQGQTWQSLEFDKEGLIVKGVLTEPGITTMVESIFGHELKEKPWTLIKLNFSQLLPNKCEDKDYIDWQPKDYNSVNTSSCLLGNVIRYKRRNPLTLCYNGELYKPTTGIENCTCTPEDYECYRKIPGDSCTEDNKDEKYVKEFMACPIVAPYKLSIISEVVNIQAGQEIKFHLEQAGGSTRNTKYVWKFGDASRPETYIGFKNSSSKKHIFNYSGHYIVTVTAENIKGNATAVAYVHVQEPISNTYIVAPWAGRAKTPVTLITVVSSRARLTDLNNDHVHFIWSFGDEPFGSRPLLTWNSTVSHIYNTSGVHRITVEAVNSVTSIFKEVLIQIFDSAEILILKFSDNVANYNFSEPLIGQLFTQRIRQQLSESAKMTVLIPGLFLDFINSCYLRQ